MKTLKERITHLQKEIENRIINGDFEVVKIDEDNPFNGYLNTINISIDGVHFRFSVHESKTYLSQHEGPVEVVWNGYKIGDLRHLYEPIEAMQLEFKEKRIKKLQNEIKALQTK